MDVSDIESAKNPYLGPDFEKSVGSSSFELADGFEPIEKFEHIESNNTLSNDGNAEDYDIYKIFAAPNEKDLGKAKLEQQKRLKQM